MVVCICVVFYFHSFVSARKAQLKLSSLGSGGRSCRLTVVFDQFFQWFSSTFWARSTKSRCFFQDTCPSVAFPVFIRSRCRKHRSHWSSESNACDGHISPFSSRARWEKGLQWLIYSLVVPVTTRASHARRFQQSPPLPLLPASCFFSFVLCILLYSLSMYCSDFIEIFVG